MPEFRTLTTRDGRDLEVFISGRSDGFPLVFHFGTPSAATEYELFVRESEARDLRLVIYSRPGYGGSARRPSRTVADCSQDVGDVTEELGIDQFVTLGWSGGGPHALACAAMLPERVLAAATIASVAPYAAEALDWMAGMGKENIEEFEAVLAGSSELQAFLEREAKDLGDITGDDVADALGDLASDVDRDSLTGDIAEFLAASFRRAIAGGIWGWYDDDLAFFGDWGFDVAEIRVPVTIWQGEQDRMVPFGHGQWLATHVPGARARLSDEHGHLSLIASFGSILDDLLERAGR